MSGERTSTPTVRQRRREGLIEKGTEGVNKQNNKGDRPFECRFCKKSFMQSGSLRKHEGIHKQ